MALTDSERARLTEYIRNRACAEFRSDRPCLDRDENPPVELDQPHPGCALAAEMIDLVEMD